MKSGGPWNLRGLRPEAREAARDAARRSGVSVGEWLNQVIREDDDSDHGEPMRAADHEDDEDEWGEEPRRKIRPESRQSSRRANGAPSTQESEPPRRRRRHRPEAEIAREAAVAREEFGEVHARLDRLTQQLERMARTSAPRLTGAPAPQPYTRAAPQPYTHPAPQPRSGAPLPSNMPSTGARTSIDDAVAEIAERQRMLYGSDQQVAPIAPMPPQPPEPMESPPAARLAADRQEPVEPAVDISNLEEQLRHITARIETLRPSNDFERVIKSFRHDLSDIGQQLTDALPRRAVESLEVEVRALATRLDHSRDAGVDLGVLAGLERGLNEVRDALHGLTPAENLVGFDDAVKALAQKVDLIIAREDPAALQQLETAIGALRGIVSHVASNDTLTKVSEDVRALAAKVDTVANSAASGQALSALEGRLDTLTNALHASTEAGQAVPHELEKLLSGLIEKLEWVQLTQTDHAALGALEDRIAQLIKRLDASDARLGNLEAVERGLADLLVHLDQIRGGSGAAKTTVTPKAPAVDAIVRDVAEIKRSDRRTQDSLEAVHGAVEHVVDRLAMIESGMHEGAANAEAPSETVAVPEPQPARQAVPERAVERTVDPAAMLGAAVAAPPPSNFEAAARRAGTSRLPIDPDLPPDHPLEPGSAAGPRAMPSAAERIAASEAAVDFAKPPVIAEPGEKANFIAAARRAAQAAAAASPERHPRAPSAEFHVIEDKNPSRVRKVLVAGGAVLVAAGFLHVALRMFQDRGTPNQAAPAASSAPSQPTAPPTVLPQPDASGSGPRRGPLILPVPGSSSDNAPASTPSAGPQPTMSAPQIAPATRQAAPASAPAPLPQQQSWLQNYSGDITGALPRRVPPLPHVQPPANIATAPPPASAPAMVNEKLPATIGGPRLRAAAIAGDAAAEFEVATRFAAGHGVPVSNEQAVRWFELAAKQGLPLAQFRLGGFYENGIVVKKDLAVARDFYAAAAAKGNGKAMHNVAVLYAEGINGPADYRTAALWFRKAADCGIKDSQYNLAILYARGIGVAQNYAESYKWFALAANSGDADSAKKRDEIATHLDAQALAAAKLSVQKWTAEPQPEDAIAIKVPPGGWDLPEHAEKATARAAAAKPISLQPKFN
ncbi:MAG: hypothetical protein WAU57_21965 [Xanthobacteraceae bacterium]